MLHHFIFFVRVVAVVFTRQLCRYGTLDSPDFRRWAEG